MSLGVPMAPAGMSTVPGMAMNPTAAPGLGMTPGLGLGASSGVAADATAVMGLGSATAATAAAPPIETECLLISNLFDQNKLVRCLFHFQLSIVKLALSVVGKPCRYVSS